MNRVVQVMIIIDATWKRRNDPGCRRKRLQAHRVGRRPSAPWSTSGQRRLSYYITSQGRLLYLVLSCPSEAG